MAGAGPAALVVERGAARLPSEFAKPSGYQIYRPGATRLALVLDGQSKPVATEKVRLGRGKYTVVAIGGKGGVDLLVYKDDGVQPGKATLRAIHAAAEVGRADIRLDGKVVVTGVGLGDATGYLPVPPGRHTVAVTRPGGKGGPLVKANVRAVAGSASSAFVVGSAGMPAQVVLTDDGSAGPTAAPATGLGGAAADGSWLLILGSALIGGTLGGTSYFLSRRVRTRGAMVVSEAAGSDVVSPAVDSDLPPMSFVAAGPPVAAKEEQDMVEAGAAEAVHAEARAAEWLVPEVPAAEAPAEAPATAGVPVGAVASSEAGNGAPARPVLWTPPPGERWLSAPGPGQEPTPVLARTEGEQSAAPSTPRFIRPDGENIPAPKLPRFIIPDEDVKPPPRFMRPPPADAVDAPAAEEMTADAENAEAAPDAALPEAAAQPVTPPSEAAVAIPEATQEPITAMPEPAGPFQPEQIQSAEPTPRFGVTEPATPRATPFWERSLEPTHPLRPAPAVPEPGALSSQPEVAWPEAPEDEPPVPGPAEPEAVEPAAEVVVPEIAEPELAAPTLRALPADSELAPEPDPVVEVSPEPTIETIPLFETPEPVIEAAPEPTIETSPLFEPTPELIIGAIPLFEATPEPAAEVIPAPEPVIEAAPEPVAEADPEPLPPGDPAPALHVVPDAKPAQATSSTAATRPGVSTWSSASAKRPTSHSTAHDVAGKVNFLVVSGAALVVTGLVVARRGGRH